MFALFYQSLYIIYAEKIGRAKSQSLTRNIRYIIHTWRIECYYWPFSLIYRRFTKIMKKSKIIVPALGILAFSTAAAVTGTVAWFTANRLAIVSNDQITVVNPEAGLSVVAENVANTLVNNNGATGSRPSITHGYDNTQAAGLKQGYLRDASMNMNTETLYKAKLAEDGQPSGFETQAIGTKDTKKYDGKDIYYATEFKLSFTISRVESAYDVGLFFDANKSSTAALTAVKDNDKLNLVYKSVRFGFKSADAWFVWAPLTDNRADTTAGSPAQASDYSIRHVTGTDLANVSDIAVANKIVGNATNTGSTSTDLNDASGPISTTYKKTTSEYAWLGTLSTTAKEVKVYTWFEGTDSACINDEFQSVVTAFTSEMQFISRRVTKSA